jgi:bifunctional non-homologous end joining protein LigD
VSLDAYRRKRDPARSPEPFSERKKRGAEPRFVVQRHAARRLHYDFRLERHGTLASWAVPKGVPLRRGERHLAVHVEDHPLEYGDFEGTIPAGEYGAGTVEIWDRGTYELLEEKRDGGLTVRLHGERLDGVWTLVPARLDGDPKNWLLLRKDGSPASASRYAPMLATASEALPRGDGWTYEPKWDGFRAIVSVSGGDAAFTSRNGNDLTERFRDLARAAQLGIRAADAVLDGEICALDDHGRSRFSLLQDGTGRHALVVFDLLELDSEPLVELPLSERRARLAPLCDESRGSVILSPQFDDGDALLAAAREQGLEGVVAKRLDSRYQPGRRSADWRKAKVRNRQEVVIAGYTRGHGRRAGGFGALVMGVQEGGGLRWAGNVGTGFSDAEIERLLKILEAIERPESPFPGPEDAASSPTRPRLVKPKLAGGRVRGVDAGGTPAGAGVPRPARGQVCLRGAQGAGLGTRRDPEGATRAPSEQPRQTVLARGGDHERRPHRVLPGRCEGAAPAPSSEAVHHEAASRWLAGKALLPKQAPPHMPSWIKRIPLPASTREGEQKIIEYALVDDELALLWMANLGCIDMHAWSSRVDRPEKPDWVMFDLDPAQGSTFADVVTVARLVKETLDLLELEGFPKTSGSRGMHVLVPIARRHTHAEAREFAAIVAGALARAHPGLVTTEWVKQKRRGVLVDANQNGPGKTNASVYSVRPRAGAPVSTPLRWDEVVPGLDPEAFTMEAVLGRVARDGDLFAGVLRGKQSLARALRALR